MCCNDFVLLGNVIILFFDGFPQFILSRVSHASTSDGPSVSQRVQFDFPSPPSFSVIPFLSTFAPSGATLFAISLPPPLLVRRQLHFVGTRRVWRHLIIWLMPRNICRENPPPPLPGSTTALATTSSARGLERRLLLVRASCSRLPRFSTSSTPSGCGVRRVA